MTAPSMRLPQSMMGRLSRSTGSAARPGWAHISTEKCYRITDVLNEQGPPLKERITSGWFCKTTQRLTCASSRSSRVGLATPSLVVFPWATSRIIRRSTSRDDPGVAEKYPPNEHHQRGDNIQSTGHRLSRKFPAKPCK